MNYLRDIERFTPQNDRQHREKAMVQKWVETFPDTILTRENEFAHLTASAMIFDETRQYVLMVYHNIYDSWSWCGGHADGETDPMQTAIREAAEETGITTLQPITDVPTGLDILPVRGHVKHGVWIAPHLHLSLCYSFIADKDAPVRSKPDENSGVRWIAVQQLEEYVTEPEMLPIYKQIIAATENL